MCEIWCKFVFYFITFRVSRRRREMIVVTRVCVTVCLSAAACLHYCTDPDVTWGSGRGCPLVVHYWADLQSVHELRCYGNITRTRNVSECMLVLALCLVLYFLLITSVVQADHSVRFRCVFVRPIRAIAVALNDL